ncbi:MAG: stage 0 sporulation family protein [Clostridia bacterium]|nr:stage 0 sporulation family protein [Clostridia bacterium]
MTEIIAIKFKKDGRVYYFDPDGMKFNDGDRVVVETSKGIECGIASGENRNVPDNQIVAPLKKVLRRANNFDLKKVSENEKKALEAFDYCEEQIAKLGLDMKLIDTEVSFDSGKMLFYFTSDGRVDFRELVKILAANYKTRIELRQIGVRDEAKLLGGLGICGQPFCCSRFLDNFQPVSIKMAKEQGLSLNPVKISGSCGRLMCCLKYEQDAYEYLNSITPQPGSIVKTPDGEGIVHDINLLTGMLLVKMGEDNAIIQKIHKDDVKVIRAYRGKGKKSSTDDEKSEKQ